MSEEIKFENIDDYIENADLPERNMSEEAVDSVTPIDLLNSKNYTNREIRNERLDICRSCPKLFKPTRTCKMCGCFMGIKTWAAEAVCPIGLWGPDMETLRKKQDS